MRWVTCVVGARPGRMQSRCSMTQRGSAWTREREAMTTPNDPKAQQGLTPEVMANQLLDVLLMQNKVDPRQAGRHVVDFLAQSLFYALTSTKQNVVDYLASALFSAIESAK